MKCLISTDLEGVCGVDSYDYISDIGSEKNILACRWLEEEINLVATACTNFGASKIIVVDGHGAGDNLKKSNLLPSIEVRSKQNFRMIQGIEEKPDVLLMVGFHGKSNTLKSFTAHSYTSKYFSEIRINGVAVGEPELNALVAKHFSVKTIFVTGTKEGINELNIPGVQSVITKNSVSWDKAVSRPREEVLLEISEKVNLALKNIDSIEFINLPTTNLSVELELNHLFVAEALPEENCGPKIVTWQAENIADAFVRIMEILTFANKKYHEIYKK